jgi:hypothetical protein
VTSAHALTQWRSARHIVVLPVVRASTPSRVRACQSSLRTCARPRLPAHRSA